MAIKKKKRGFDILVFLFVIAIALGSYSSYSRYTSSVAGTSSIDVAAWNVRVNTEDITNTANLSQNISFTPISSQYVAEGKMAPSVGGYFDIIIDTTNAEVASTYTINIDVTDLEDLTEFSVAGYEIFDAGDVIPSTVTEIPSDLESATTRTANNRTYSVISSGVITLDSNGKGSSETVRVYLEWSENGTNPSSSNVQIPVNIEVEQYFG